MAAGSLSLLIVPVIKSKMSGINFAKSVRLDTKTDRRTALLALLMVVAALFMTMPLVLLYSYFLDKIGYDPTSPISMEKTKDAIAAFIVVGLIAPVSEEVFMRGVIANGFETIGKVKGALLSGFLFMLLHMNPAQVVHQFILGALIAMVYYYTHNLKIAILMHIVNNIIGLLINYVPEAVVVYLFAEIFYITAPLGIFLVVICLRRIKALRPVDTVQDEQNIAAEFIYNPPKKTTVFVDTVLFVFGILICAFVWFINLMT
jgi:membrane protease YdiL (CAAX protease family)